MGADCTGRAANVAIKRCALSTLKGNGRSKMKWTGVAVYVVHLFEETAHWRIATCVNGELFTTESSSTSLALRHSLLLKLTEADDVAIVRTVGILLLSRLLSKAGSTLFFISLNPAVYRTCHDDQVTQDRGCGTRNLDNQGV